MPLYVRNWEPGDQFQRCGHAGKEKVKSLFQEQRVAALGKAALASGCRRRRNRLGSPLRGCVPSLRPQRPAGNGFASCIGRNHEAAGE